MNTRVHSLAILSILGFGLVASEATARPSRGRKIKADKDGSAPALSYDAFRRTVEFQVAEKREEQIQGIRRLLDLGPEEDEIPGLQFRLAELYYEKAQFSFFRSQEAQEAAVESKSATEAEVRREESEEFIREQRFWTEEALTLYREIRDVYPSYTGMPEVLFALGQAQWQQQQLDEARQVYADLIRSYPDSPLVSDAWLKIGEFHFENKDVDRALQSYEKAAEDKRSRVYGFALYKQAWCYFNLSQWEKALRKFEGTVRYARRSTELSGENKIALGREAKKDYVRTYAHVGDPKRARILFADLLGEDRCTSDECRRMLDQLAGLWFESGYFSESAELYRGLIAGRPDDLRNAFRQTRVVDLVSRQGTKKRVLVEARALVDTYRGLAERAGEDPEARAALEETELSTESTIRTLAQVWNREARKTRTQRTFGYALSMYELYLDVFPDAELSYPMRFQLADLYYKLERFDPAAEAFRLTVLAKPGGEHLVDAATDQIRAVEEHLRDLDIESPEAGLEPAPIHPQKQRLIDACDLYVKSVPAEKAEQVEVVKFKAAKVLYEYNHFDDAVPRFEEIVENHPETDQAEYAANLVIDVYNLRKNWSAIYETARAYRANAQLTRGRRELVADLDKYAQFAKFRLIQGLEKRAEAKEVSDRTVAEAYEEFYREFPRAKDADKALFNASVAWDRAGEKARAREARRRLLTDFEDSPLRADVAHYAARQFEERTEYAEAARAFRTFAKNYPDDERAPDALYNAAVFYAAMGQVETAAELRLEYIEQYGRKKADRSETADLYWAIAADLDDGGRVREAIKAYAEFRQRFPRDPRFWTALAREADIREARLGQKTTARKLRAELMGRYRRQSAPPDTAKRAAASFTLAEIESDRAAYGKLRIVRPNLRNPRPFKKSLEAKAAARDRLIRRYTAVVTDYRQAESSIAALNRIATLWTSFVDALVAVPCPRGLNAEACFLFKNEIETMAAPARESGLEAYGACVDKSRELGLFTAESTDCIEELERQGVLAPLVEISAPIELPETTTPPMPRGPLTDLPPAPVGTGGDS